MLRCVKIKREHRDQRQQEEKTLTPLKWEQNYQNRKRGDCTENVEWNNVKTSTSPAPFDGDIKLTDVVFLEFKIPLLQATDLAGAVDKFVNHVGQQLEV